MTRVVLDTNLIVSAILSPQGKPAAILKMALEAKLDLVLSPAILEEVSLVLSYDRIIKLLTKRSVMPEQLKNVLQKIVKTAIMVPGKLEVHQIDKDPSDNMLLACALEGKVDFIISGDHHLTDLNEYKNIQIINPDTFLRFMEKKS